MKILFVTPAPPFPPCDGARLIVASLARALAPEHSLYLVTFAERDGTTAKMREWFADSHVVPLPEVGKVRKWLKTLTDPLPMWIRANRSDAMRETLRAVTQAHEPDVVHLDTALMAQYADAVAPLPVVMAPHDSLTLYLEQKMQLGLTFRDRATARLEYPKMRRYEAAQYRRAERICVVSPHERDYLNALVPALDVKVIPNGVDTEYFLPQRGTAQTAGIGFLGTMDYSVNRRAALYFAREVMPLVWQAKPDVVFTMIGRDPAPEILALTDDSRIRVSGTVKDVRPLVAAQWVMVAPMQEASGIKNKLLEAMAMGKAIVTTSQGLGGIEALTNQELLVGANADELAAACVTLLNDVGLRDRLGKHARAWALEHTWQKTAGCYLELYREAIHAAAGR